MFSWARISPCQSVFSSPGSPRLRDGKTDLGLSPRSGLWTAMLALRRRCPSDCWLLSTARDRRRNDCGTSGAYRLSSADHPLVRRGHISHIPQAQDDAPYIHTWGYQRSLTPADYSEKHLSRYLGIPIILEWCSTRTVLLRWRRWMGDAGPRDYVLELMTKVGPMAGCKKRGGLTVPELLSDLYRDTSHTIPNEVE